MKDAVLIPRWDLAPNGAATRGPPIKPLDIDVWRIDLDRSDLVAADCPSATRRRSLAHAAIQLILRRYLAQDAPDPLPLARRSGGKPYLDIADCALEFNLSHSADTALLAVALHRQVGIDVEFRRRMADPLRLAERVMPRDWVERLRRTPTERRQDRFLELWTRLEAQQKALGRGIFAEPADPQQCLCVTFEPAANGYACLCVVEPASHLVTRFFDHQWV